MLSACNENDANTLCLLLTYCAESIYPAGTQQPVGGGPNSILNRSFDPGTVGPGSVQSYEVPIKYVTETVPGTYAFSVVIDTPPLMELVFF